MKLIVLFRSSTWASHLLKMAKVAIRPRMQLHLVARSQTDHSDIMKTFPKAMAMAMENVQSYEVFPLHGLLLI